MKIRNYRDGDGEVAVVRDADVDLAAGQRRRRRNLHVRPAVLAGQNLDVAHARPWDPARHRLANRLFGSPAAGPALGAVAAIRDLPVAEELPQEAIAEPSLG